MFSMLAIAFLVIAFAILVWTFVWVARLLAHRAQEKELAGKAEAAQPEVEAEGVEAAEEIEGPELVQGRGSSANYGLLLGALSCGLYWISPLVMAMAFIGSFYSLRALLMGCATSAS